MGESVFPAPESPSPIVPMLWEGVGVGGVGLARSRVSGSIHSRPWEEGGGGSHLPAPLLPRCSLGPGLYPKLNHRH